MNLAVALTAFLLVIPVELPDKTFIATLVLATKYHPLPTWVGVGLAFAVQSLVAVTLGGLIAQLPHRPAPLSRRRSRSPQAGPPYNLRRRRDATRADRVCVSPAKSRRA